MSNQSVATFDVTTHLRDRVREVLVASIPDEQMDAMIRKEINAFFEKSRNHNGAYSSPFAVLVEGMLHELVKKKVAVWLDTNFERVWDSEGQNEKLIGDTVAQLIPIVQQKYISDMVSKILGEIRMRTY